MVNRTIKNFEIKELIATGGMAAIYRAVQISLDRVVAIKILHGHLAQDKDFITRFEREAKAAANLKHENIVNIIDFGQSEDLYFIAMEFVDGKSLKDLIAAVGCIPYDIAMMIAYEISQGLSHAHEKGVVHRDIKPANILISQSGSSKIADFGLAQAQDLTSVTVTGLILGTPAYMSPEQASGRKIDGRSDIFSLGVVLYEMITGEKPFKGQNYSSIIHEILTVEPVKPIEANPLIPRDINVLIEKMLAKDPAQRHQTIQEVIDEIKSFFRKAKIEFSRTNVRDFLAVPDGYVRQLNQTRKEKHLERGLYFMGLGKGKIDEAITEFEKVVQLDPADTRAGKYLSELKAKKERRDAQPPVKPIKGAADVRRKPSALKLLLIPVVMLVVAAAVFLLVRTKKVPSFNAEPVSYGLIRINSQPEGAVVYLDQLNLGRITPAVLDSIPPGAHTIELQLTGYQAWRSSLNIRAGDTIMEAPVLTPALKPAVYSRLEIRSTPTAAFVYLDNINTGRYTPCVINSVEVGPHMIKVMKTGYESAESQVQLKPDQPGLLTFNLKPITETPVHGTAYLKITVTPWAKIYIDDQYVETTPIARSLAVTAGEHKLRLENPNFKVWEKRQVFPAGQIVTLDVQLTALDGQLKLTVKPWADVYLDGKFYETTPLAGPINLNAGKHVLKLINPTFKTYEETIEIPAADTLKKHIELEKK